MKDFLNAKSMLTPGVAGGTTMLLTNTLASSFGWPPNYCGLALSFVAGLVVFGQPGMKWYQRAAFYVMNSLVIFSVAMGSNQVGVTRGKEADLESAGDPAATADATGHATGDAPAAVSRETPFFANWLDGTVQKREELTAETDTVTDAEAKAILDGMRADPNLARQIPAVAPGHEKAALKQVVRSSRTADEVQSYKAEIRRRGPR